MQLSISFRFAFVACLDHIVRSTFPQLRERDGAGPEEREAASGAWRLPQLMVILCHMFVCWGARLLVREMISSTLS